MLPFFGYILKVIICSGILFGYYWLFLRNKVFNQYNRFYLLGALIVSLSLPLLKVDLLQQGDQHSQVIKALQVVSAGDDYMNNMVITANKDSWSFQQLYPLIYWIASIIFFISLLQTFFAIRALLKKYPVRPIDDISFVNTNDKSTPFSFFRYIFWNANIDMQSTTGKQIFKHEMAHIRERHSHDKLFINLILCFFWCNPFFWFYRKELNMIHEFIADKKAVEDNDTAAFAAMILLVSYPQHRFPLTNNFFYSPIKRRLFMLTKTKNPRLSYIARIMVLPLAALIFIAFTFKVKSLNKDVNTVAPYLLQDTIPSRSKDSTKYLAEEKQERLLQKLRSGNAEEKLMLKSKDSLVELEILNQKLQELETLRQKLSPLQEKQNLEKLNAEKELLLKLTEADLNQAVLKGNVQKQEILKEKQKAILEQYNKATLDHAATELILKQSILENKLKSQDLSQEKQKLLLEQYNKAKLDQLEKELLLKKTDMQLNKILLENKLNTQGLLEEKQKLLLEQYDKAKLDQLEKALLQKTKDEVLEKILLIQKDSLRKQEKQQ